MADQQPFYILFFSHLYNNGAKMFEAEALMFFFFAISFNYCIKES